MKIVVLDGFTLNPGDLDWKGLRELGEVKVYERTRPEELLRRALQASVIITNKVPLNAELIDQLPDLKYIGVTATGYNIVDTEAAARRGIVVTNVPGYSTDSVVQLAFSLLLDLCHHAREHGDSVRRGEWAACADFSYSKFPLMELAGKTLGIIGYGAIGQKMANVALAFGMRIRAFSRRKPQDLDESRIQWSAIEDILRHSDVVSLHCPLTPDTRELINKESLRLMKKSAFLINTSRGPLINEAQLAEALNAGRISGAGLDVLAQEPPDAANPLLTARNCLITPHIAWASFEARERLMSVVIHNLKSFIDNTPMNVVA